MAYSNVTLRKEAMGTRFQFLHDRVQQASYELIEKDKRPTVHLNIGRTLLAVISSVYNVVD